MFPTLNNFLTSEDVLSSRVNDIINKHFIFLIMKIGETEAFKSMILTWKMSTYATLISVKKSQIELCYGTTLLSRYKKETLFFN